MPAHDTRPPDRRRFLTRLYNTLEAAQGPMDWWPAETPFEVCVGAILTQNAPWSGVSASIDALKAEDLLSPEALAAADEQTVAAAIRRSIYYNQKAKRLKLFCRFLLDELDGGIETMRSWELTAARERLLALNGIGFETADSILLYALGRPVFVVDAYTRRILSRHGLVERDCAYEPMRRFFEDAIEPDAALYNEYHALLCHLGAVYCRKKPLCGSCPARDVMGEPVL